MSSVNHQMISFWDALPQTTVRTTTLAAGKVIYKGVLGFSVDGKAYDTDSVLNAVGNPLYLTVAGADANGGVIVWSKQQNVRYVQIGSAGTQALSVSMVTNVVLHTIDITVLIGTNMGTVTSTANDVVAALLAHAGISSILRFGATGTGLGLVAASPGVTPQFQHVPQIFLLGVAQNTYDNSASMTDLVDEFRFTQGICRLASLPTDPITPAMKGGLVGIADNITVKGTPTSLDYTAKLIDVATSGAIYVNIQA